MKRKRIVVMGFMGSCPIAGVIWQHVHYIVGLQRLGHDVYYIEDSARIPYNAETFDTNNDFSYATRLLARLASEFDFKERWAFCARDLPELATATGCRRSLENATATAIRRRFHVGGKLVDQRIERHRLSREESSMEQVA